MLNLLEERDYWLILGKYGTGKSRLAAQMTPDKIVLDIDGRWAEQVGFSTGKTHIIKNDTVGKMAEEMEALRRTTTGVYTVIVDSGTALLDYETSADRNNAVQANLAFRRKADIMRVMVGASLRWSANVVWIFHVDQSMVNGKPTKRITLPTMEVERMKKSLNAIIELDFDQNKKRLARILWSRYNDERGEGGPATGHIIKDPGNWIGTPRLISQFIREYKGCEGYKGVAYSPAWLLDFLAEKGKVYPDVETMMAALGPAPAWYDRNAWAELIRKAGVDV